MIVMQEEFLTVDEVAKILRVSRDTVIAMLENKEIDYYRVRRQYRISRTDFERYMEEQKNKK